MDDRTTRAVEAVRRQVRDRMYDLRMTQQDLAINASVSYKTVQRFFTGAVERATHRALSRALGWPDDEIERRLGLESARAEIDEVEATVPGVIVLRLGERLASLPADEQAEVRSILEATALSAIGAIRARTPGAGFHLPLTHRLAG